MRAVAMLILGLVIGVFGAVSALSALRSTTPLSRGVMSVMSYHHQQLRELPSAGKCEAVVIERHLRSLRALADDVPAAFLPLGNDDALFERRVQQFRASTDKALAAAPESCAALAEVIGAIGDGCKLCHRDFRG